MRAHTRKLPTDRSNHIDARVRDEEDVPMSAEEAIAKIASGCPKWSVMLRGLRNREGLTQAQLGDLVGINQTNISQMERGIRTIGKAIRGFLSDRLSTVFVNGVLKTIR